MFYVSLILIVLGLIAFGILMTPFRLIIDSVLGVYRLEFGRLASGELVMEDAQPYVDVKVLFWKRRFNPFELKSGEAREWKGETSIEGKRPKKVGAERKRRLIGLRKVLAIVQSFKVNRFKIRINTGDMPLNGVMYPLIYWLAFRTRKDIAIVFYGQSVVRINIENNLARMTWAYIKTK